MNQKLLQTLRINKGRCARCGQYKLYASPIDWCWCLDCHNQFANELIEEMDLKSNPVSHVDISNPNQDALDCGYTTPGWYFADETWSWMYGPFESKEEADRKCAEYARTL